MLAFFERSNHRKLWWGRDSMELVVGHGSDLSNAKTFR